MASACLRPRLVSGRSSSARPSRAAAGVRVADEVELHLHQPGPRRQPCPSERPQLPENGGQRRPAGGRCRRRWWTSRPRGAGSGGRRRPSPRAPATARATRTSRRCPEWAAMPARSRPSSTACGSTPSTPRHTRWGSRSDRVAVDQPARPSQRRRRRRGPGRSAGAARRPRPPAAAAGQRRGGGAEAGDGGDVLEARPGGPAPGRRRRGAGGGAGRGARAARRRPAGPPSLWALTDSRSAPRASKSIGTWPAAWAASTWTSTPRSRQAATTSATGWTRADLVVAPLHVHERGVGADGGRAARRGRPARGRRRRRR